MSHPNGSPTFYQGVALCMRSSQRSASAKRKELYAKFPSTWVHGDQHIGRIPSDGAALITFAKAPGEVPVHPPETAGERLVEYLLRKEAKAGAGAKVKAGVDAEAA
jgi:hypothetical protein